MEIKQSTALYNPLNVNDVMEFCGRLVNGDPNSILTFQTFDDRKNGGTATNKGLVSVFHCRKDRVEYILNTHIKPLIQQGAGVSVMVNQGDGQGRKAKNVTKVRAVFVDLDEDGEAALEKIKASPETPPPHLIVETSLGKFHVYWFVDGMERSDFKPVQKELSQRFGGDPNVTDLPRVLRIPGSLHQKGKPFRVKIVSENPAPPYSADIFTNLLSKSTENPLAVVSDQSFEAFMEQVNAKKTPTEQLRKMLSYINQAENYERWIKVGMALHPLGDDGLKLWLEWSSRAVNYDEKTCRSKWLSFGKYTEEKVTIGTIYYLAREGGWVQSGGQEHLTDAGNAQRLIRIFGFKIRYSPEYKSWLIWNGERWVFDHDGILTRLAIESVRKIVEEVKEDEDSDRRTKAIKWAFHSESKSRIDAAITLAQSVEGVTIHTVELDVDSLLLNVRNGTIDLRTGKLNSHSRKDRITNLVEIDYPKGITVPLVWYQFLNEIFGGDSELIEYVQRVVGYCLTGDVREQCLFFLYGTGANGKTTFINILSLITGSYATQTATETFMTKQNAGNATPELAVLNGKRVVTANETDEGKHFAEPTIKQLCGGDQITARPLYCEPFNFLPKFKILIAGNYKPQIKGNDLGIWRRIHLIPFSVTIPPEKQDKLLEAKLKAELPMILQWAVEGCLKWQQQGLSPPQSVIHAVEEYRESMDTIGQWLDQCCSFGPGFITQSSQLYSSYKAWVINAGNAPMSQKRLGESLRMRGLQSIKIGGARSWQGVKIKMFDGVVIPNPAAL